MRYTLKALQNMLTGDQVSAEIDGQWVPARPLGWRGFLGFRKRLRDAWDVVRDRADIVVWPGDQ